MEKQMNTPASNSAMPSPSFICLLRLIFSLTGVSSFLERSFVVFFLVEAILVSLAKVVFYTVGSSIGYSGTVKLKISVYNV